MNPRYRVTVSLLAATLFPAVLFAAEPEALCADCHGKDGASTEKDVPIIGGVSELYLIDAMAAYRDKARPCPETAYRSGDTKRPKTTMCKIASELSEAETEKIAQHLAKEPFVPAKQPFDKAKAETGKKIHDLACEKCHSEGGSLAEDDAAVLAGQWMPYLKETFEQYANGSREQPKKMKPKLDPLKPEQIEALLHYYASQQ